jgi:dTDP-4-dehydrorhamnose 3,5-epimerase
MGKRVKKITDVKIIKTKLHLDNRGYFFESFSEKKQYNSLNVNFLQDNISLSKKNVIRGLHYRHKPQSQLLTLVYGKIFDVIVDLRKNSKNFQNWIGINLDHTKNNQIYMPPGVAHGFCVLSDFAILHYKVTKKYDKNNEAGIKWNDDILNVKWPIKKPIISKKDNSLPKFSKIFNL